MVKFSSWQSMLAQWGHRQQKKKKRVHKVNNGEQAASIEKEMMLNKNTEKNINAAD